MKEKITAISFLIIAVSIVFCSYVDGPALHGYDCTGAETNNREGNPTGCSTGGNGCHNTSATTAITTTLELDSAGTAVTSYLSGHTYTIKLSGVNTGSTSQPDFGFEIASIKGTTAPATATDAGTWGAPPANTNIGPPYAPYTTLNIFEHSEALPATSGSGGYGTTYVESISWTAPAAGTGAISFWAALNTISSSDVSSGNNGTSDLWNTTKITISEETPGVTDTTDTTSGISSIFQKDEINIYPNPVSNNLNLQWQNAATGNYIVSVYNLQGQRITLQNVVMNGGASSQKINTAEWTPGMYAVSVEKDNNKEVFRIIKQ